MRRIVYSKFEADHVFLLKKIINPKNHYLLNKLFIIKI